MKENDIPTAVYYRKPLHKQDAFRGYAFDELDYEITDRVSTRCLSLPMHPYLDEERITKIANKIYRKN